MVALLMEVGPDITLILSSTTFTWSMLTVTSFLPPEPLVLNWGSIHALPPKREESKNPFSLLEPFDCGMNGLC